MGGMGGGMGGAATGNPSGGGQKALPHATAFDRGFALKNSSTGARTEAGSAGEALQTTFSNVSVPAGQAVVLDAKPFDVSSELMTVYAAGSEDAPPLLSLKLSNQSAMRLPAGPLSVFLEDTGYAGDAMLPLLSPGVERLVGFAVDDGVRISAEPVKYNEERLEFSIDQSKRAVVVTDQLARTEAIVVNNRSGSTRRVAIDHGSLPSGYEWTEESPQRERTETGWRFFVELAHNESETLTLRSEKTEKNYSQFSTVSLAQIRTWMEHDEFIDEAERKVLVEVLEKRTKLAELIERLKKLGNRRQVLLMQIKRLTGQLARDHFRLSQQLLDSYQKQLLGCETALKELDDKFDKLKDEAEDLEDQLNPEFGPREATSVSSQLTNAAKREQSDDRFGEPSGADETDPFNHDPFGAHPAGLDPFGN